MAVVVILDAPGSVPALIVNDAVERGADVTVSLPNGLFVGLGL